MHRNEFSRLLQSEVQLLDNYLNSISSRAQFLSDKIRFLSFQSLRAKLAFYILQHARGKDSIKLPFTHQNMAEMFGVARPSLSREIRNMNDEGLIKSDREFLTILDVDAMRKLIQ
jgi:CRP-like cAMP-binding protein